MKQLAPGVWRLKEFPRPTINVYLAEDVLIDAGRRWDRRRIFAEIEGREISLLALTHAHPDHQGVAKDVCEAAASRSPATPTTSTRWRAAARCRRRAEPPGQPGDRRIWQGPPYKVDRVSARAMRSPASASSTPPATPAAR